MKRFHLPVFLTVAALFIALSAFAQEQPVPGQGGHMRHMPSVDDQTKELAIALKLSDDQTKQVHAILQDQQDQRQKLMQDQSVPFEEKRPKMREIHETDSGKIRALLTDDQKTKYDQIEKEQQERRQHWKEQKDSGNSTAPQ